MQEPPLRTLDPRRLPGFDASRRSGRAETLFGHWGARHLDRRIEITRTVSLLRSVLRAELEGCTKLIEDGDIERLQKQISEARDKLGRAIYALNRLR